MLQIPAFTDNYIYLLIDGEEAAVVDPGEAGPVIKALEDRNLKLRWILNTHHHRDHVGGNLELIDRFGCEVWGAAKDAARIPGIQRRLEVNEAFTLFGKKFQVMPADGHTVGHIVFHVPEARALFCGDTIFSLGCGKLFEGSPAQMWDSLSRLRDLPGDTLVYCAHEYTLENAAFALRAEPANPDLRARVTECETLRRGGNPTVPSTMAMECATNPFLRPESPILQKFAHMEGEELWKIFGKLRHCKDQFDDGEEV
ncbi:MAG: hydroxyacylglutathione hydrolase [Proteobacteria bacterium]|nr:MAG: hydroxyacylglutathione hydrolase [Pseudomonadota bacterium]